MTIATVRIDTIDARSVWFTCVHAAIVNISVLTGGKCYVASQCVSNVVSLITRLIQIRSFMMMFFDLIIMLRDTCFRFLEESITFQFISIICVMLLVLCFGA